MTDEEFYHKYIKDLADYRLKEIEENSLMKKCIKDAFCSEINRALEVFERGAISYSEAIDWILHPGDRPTDKKISRTIPSGYKITASFEEDYPYPSELYVYVTDEENRIVQDLVMVRSHDINSFAVYLWGDKESEDVTDKFDIDLYDEEREVD